MERKFISYSIFFFRPNIITRNNQKKLFNTNKKLEFDTEDQVFDFVVVANDKPKDMNGYIKCFHGVLLRPIQFVTETELIHF